MPDRPDEFDEAWARIVEELTSGRDSTTAGLDSAGSAPASPGTVAPTQPGATATGPAAPGSTGSDSSTPLTEPGLGGGPGSGPSPGTGAGTGAGTGPGLESLFEPLRRARPAPTPDPDADPGAFVDSWEDEGHFVPPPPPEIPEGTPIKRLAWAGLLGGPTTFILEALTPWDPPGIVTIAAALATLAGFVTLVWLMPDSREDGWDDGARV
jgi:hypothetical protein